jgi:hypothetical protein
MEDWMKTILAGAVLVSLFSLSATAATVTPTFSQVAVETGTAQETTVFRADLTGFAGLNQIGSITITDSNSGVGGSAGAFSGFDVDAIFLDFDGDYTTTGDQAYASSFLFSPGNIRAGSAPASNTSGALNGSNANGTVNEAFATLNAIDAIWFGAGSISLGDGGSLTANFVPELAVPSSLFLIISEVGNEPGEAINALIEVRTEPQVIPLPASLFLLLAALGGLGAIARRRS